MTPTERTARPIRLNSLKSTLLVLLIPAVVIIMLVFLWFSNQSLQKQVNAAFDRSLAGALRSIEVNIRTDSGGLGMEQPFYLLEFLALTTRSTVFFRVATEDNLSEIGYSDLPLPDMALQTNRPVFYNSLYAGEQIRVAAVAIVPQPGLTYSPDSRVIIQVGENLESRQDFINQVVLQSVLKDAAVLSLITLLLSTGVILVLRPLKKTSEDIRNRSFNDLQPIDEHDLPREIQPMVQAINLHMERYANKARSQQQFLDDASHQLRTPLSVLTTQVEYARQIADTPEMHEVLQAIQERINNTIRLTNQLVSLAKVNDAADKLTSRAAKQHVDLCEVASQVVNDMLPAARRKRMDFGLELPEFAITVSGIDWLINQALTNMVSNAILYCPARSRITVSAGYLANRPYIQVEDNGPGMSDQDIALAGHRFRRGASGKALHGSGLGLAIVQTIADVHHATIELRRAEHDRGLIARLIFPGKN